MTDFESARGPGDVRTAYLEAGKIKLTSYGLYFGEITYQNLHQSEYAGVEINAKERLIRLLPSAAFSNGWKVRDASTKNGILRKLLRPSRSANSPIKKLPVGIYSPVGGEVYAYQDNDN